MSLETHEEKVPSSEPSLLLQEAGVGARRPIEPGNGGLDSSEHMEEGGKPV